MQYIKDRLAHKPVAPLYTNTLLGFYEGLQHTAAHSTAAHSGTQQYTAAHSSMRREHDMLYSLTLADGREVDPGYVGTLLRGANLFHGPACCVESVPVRFPQLCSDGSLSQGPARTLLRTRVAAERLQQPEQWAVDPGGHKFRMGQQLGEWGWDYAALVTDAADPLLRMPCFCPMCKRRLHGWNKAELPPESLLIYKLADLQPQPVEKPP